MSGWVALPAEELRPASASRIKQHYEGHGVVIPPPLHRGFPTATARPPSAPAEPEQRTRARQQTKRPQLVVHVHLREKVIDINIGYGSQRVYWLALTACQRYLQVPSVPTRPPPQRSFGSLVMSCAVCLQDFDTYQHEFGGELTPKGVVTAECELLDNRACIRDELHAGDHVWVDVGDGTCPHLICQVARPALKRLRRWLHVIHLEPAHHRRAALGSKVSSDWAEQFRAG